jgi:hypothetical protein
MPNVKEFIVDGNYIIALIETMEPLTNGAMLLIGVTMVE